VLLHSSAITVKLIVAREVPSLELHELVVCDLAYLKRQVLLLKHEVMWGHFLKDNLLNAGFPGSAQPTHGVRVPARGLEGKQDRQITTSSREGTHRGRPISSMRGF
jgi:hypothetical protein